MTEPYCILPPASAGDHTGAYRVFHDFWVMYREELSGTEQYLTQIMNESGPMFAEAYRPWHKAVKDLLQGLFLTAKKMPLKNPKAFRDALRMLSLKGAANMLRDACASCRIRVCEGWENLFLRNMRALSQAFHVLVRTQEVAILR